MKVDGAALKANLDELIRAQVSSAIPGEEKMTIVVDEAVRWLDDQVRWGFLGPLALLAEAVDGPVLRLAVGLVADIVYGEMKKIGQV